MAELRQNTWSLDEWYAQDVAGDAGYTAVDPGKLFTWGRQSVPAGVNGSLGHNNNTDYSSPKQVGTDTTWLWVYATAAIKSDGTLWMNGGQSGGGGANDQGNLGLNDTISRSSPTQVGTDTTWKSVCTGGGTRATKTDGTLWWWGYGANGQSGLNFNEPSNRLSSPTQIGTDTDWDRVFTGGGGHTGCFKTDGTLWMWGNNTKGQCGNNTVARLSSPTQLPGTWTSTLCSSSYAVTYCARSDGTIWSWGDNEYGELGHNDTVMRSSPVQIASNVTTWKSITTGSAATLATKSDGTMYGWGQNTNGKCMLNTGDKLSSPTQVGTDSNWAYVNSGGDWSMASKTDGTIWMAGLNEYGQIGNGQSNMTSYSSPIQLPGTDWVVQKCFGGNSIRPKAKKAA